MLRPKPEVTPESAGGHATLVARDVKWPTQPKHQTGCVKHQAILVTEFPLILMSVQTCKSHFMQLR